MTKIHLLIFALLLVSFPAQAQRSAGKARLADFVVLNSKDTLHGEVTGKVPCGIGSSYFCKVKITTPADGKKTFRADEIIGFRNNNATYRSATPRRENASVFVKQIVAGTISYYNWELNNGSMRSLVLCHFIAKDNGRLTEFDDEEELVDRHLSGCKGFRQALGPRNPKKFKVSELVTMYNSQCQ